MSGARVAFERKLNGPMAPQAGARDRMVPFKPVREVQSLVMKRET